MLYNKAHLNIDKKHPTITVPNKKPMFLRTIHEHSDVTIMSENILKNFSNKDLDKEVSLSVLNEHFTLSFTNEKWLGRKVREIKKIYWDLK